ncbi:MAG: DUF3696 domain-containing protein [Candidatus Riflebacteria bacterium]|nr:DUF3696 domain-containing protein [Candidatus Riflebacteria bacterium]
MSICGMRLRGFKCFSDSGEIPLAPLTVIFGRNNSGKSSILQSLLLLRQTLDSGYGPQLDLRGPLYAAGTYGDIVHQHRALENIEIALEVSLAGGNESAVVEFEFRSHEPQPPQLARLTVRGKAVDPLEIRSKGRRNGAYQLFIRGRSRGTEEEAVTRSALETLEADLKGIRAVGAFRKQPDRRYEYQGRALDEIDAAGQWVVDALVEDSVRRGTKRGVLFRDVNDWLQEVCRVRLRPLKRISTSARIFELRLKDTDSSRWANFADVGFGIGQAFPVLVEGLRTPPGGMFLVQEPEIHLHPDAQLRMADFLVALASTQRRVVAETHSENLLLRIRRSLLGAGSRAPQLTPSDVSVIFVTKRKDGTSRAVPLRVDEMAQISDWPEGFMEDTTEERIAILNEMASSRE